nr:reverse transcriptase domain-containing protein [Tanacetum cinerariifolium]
TRTSIEGQILADFIVERLKDNPLDTPIEAEEELSDPWTLFTDRSSYVDGSKAGLILTNPEGTEFTYALRFRHDAIPRKSENTRQELQKVLNQTELKEKSINKAKVLVIVEEKGDTWMTPIYEYLTKETLPMEKEKVRFIRRKSRRYAVINRILYKKSYLGLWFRYVGPLQANYVLRDIHRGLAVCMPEQDSW